MKNVIRKDESILHKRPNLLKWDLLICLALPFFVWRFVAPTIGDRQTIVLIAAIGIVYSLYDFLKYKQFNFIVVYSLLISLSGDLIALLTESPRQLMFNFVVFNVVTILIQIALWVGVKSVPMLYFINGGMRLGYSKADSTEFTMQPFFRKPFIIMSLAYIGKDCFDILNRLYYLQSSLDNAYGSMTQVSSVVGTAFSIGMTAWGFSLVNRANAIARVEAEADSIVVEVIKATK